MKYGCIGERLGHSFSKEIHNRLFDYEYKLKEIAPEDLESFMKAHDFCAINVTIPYKEKVLPYLDDISDIARSIGAVNTVVNRDGKLYGDNTDFGGMRALLHNARISLQGKKVLILGSGGTSKTAVAVATAEHAASVYRVSRRGGNGCITYECAKEQHSDADILINTTPCGMYPHIGESAIDIACFPRLAGVIDAVYNPLRSKLVSDALKRGITAVGGLYMLVAQAALAAEQFVGKKVFSETIDRIFNELFAQKQNVVLVGMPGCGKTTVGGLLAKRWNKVFVDTDEEIIRQTGISIPEIFKKYGESVFRDKEAAVIREVSARQGCVIATGGGAILRDENVQLLKENGTVLFLDRPLEQLVATKDRPLSSDAEGLKKRYEERYHRYCACCDHRIESNTTPQAAVLAIEEVLYETVGN